MQRLESEAKLQGRIVKELGVAACLNEIVGSPRVGPGGSKSYLDDFLHEAGDPTDPIERMLLEQMALAHHRLAHLHTRAHAAEDVEHIKAYNAATSRLLGETRRLALTIRLYRTPTAPRSFSIVHQQNIAGGGQAVTYAHQVGPDSKESLNCTDTQVGSKPSWIQANDDTILYRTEPTKGSRWETQPLEAAGVE